MLRLFAVATVAMMLMAAIGLSVGEEKVNAYFTGSQSVPHVVSTFFYGLSGR
jgi:hypothetical protein